MRASIAMHACMQCMQASIAMYACIAMHANKHCNACIQVRISMHACIKHCNVCKEALQCMQALQYMQTSTAMHACKHCNAFKQAFQCMRLFRGLHWPISLCQKKPRPIELRHKNKLLWKIIQNQYQLNTIVYYQPMNTTLVE